MNMKEVIVFSALVAVATCTFEPGLRVRYGSNSSEIGKTFMYDVPKNISEAEAAGWTLTPRSEGPLPSLTLYCVVNRTVCTLYEPITGYVAGLQIAFDTTEFTDAIYNWTVQGFTSWTPADDGKTYWATQQYYVTEEYLARTAEERQALRNSSKTLQLDTVWVSGDDKLVEMNNTKAGLVDAGFVAQGCVNWMGTHYYLNMSRSLECTSEAQFPWFGLITDEAMFATGLILYGKLPVNPVRDYFERQTRASISAVIPDAPDCLLDVTDDPGIFSIHIYYVNDPWDIYCS